MEEKELSYEETIERLEKCYSALYEIRSAKEGSGESHEDSQAVGEPYKIKEKIKKIENFPFGLITFILFAAGIGCYAAFYYHLGNGNQALITLVIMYLVIRYLVKGIKHLILAPLNNELKEANKRSTQAYNKRYDKQALLSQKYKDLLSFIPYDYQDVQTVKCLLDYLKQKRVKTLPEALNLYDEIKHRERLEANQEAILRNQSYLESRQDELEERQKWLY